MGGVPPKSYILLRFPNGEFLISTSPLTCGVILSLTREVFISGDVEPVWRLGLDTVNSPGSDTILEFGASNPKPMDHGWSSP